MGTASSWIAMTLGVSHGSVLRALLFIMYVSWIRDPPQLNPKHLRIPQYTSKLPANLSQFADDIKAYNSAKDRATVHKNIQEAVDQIEKFSDERKIKITVQKAKN